MSCGANLTPLSNPQFKPFGRGRLDTTQPHPRDSGSTWLWSQAWSPRLAVPNCDLLLKLILFDHRIEGIDVSQIAERAPGLTRHRATYTLELGLWYATCRLCGHRVEDQDRRRAAAQFRRHIQDMNEAQADVVVDLRDVAEVQSGSEVAIIASSGAG